MTAARQMTPAAWADEATAFIGCTMGEATLADVARGRALIDAKPDEGLSGPWHEIADLLGTWVRRREAMTRVIGFHVPLGLLDRALADLPKPSHRWLDRKDVA